MNRREMLRLAAAAAAACGLPGRQAQALEGPELRLLSRRRAVEAARRLCADGWRMRDGIWTGTLGASRHAIPVHLMAGNTYLFVLAIRPINSQHVFSLLDSFGKLVAEKSVVSDAGLAAVLCEAPASGRHHLFADAPSGSASSEVAAVYLYR
ncbi:MAG: hypothetical protein ACR2OZ_18745 [Verrucomicrobiales bacterium]